jgi:WXG100 family type VII secretion target
MLHFMDVCLDHPAFRAAISGVDAAAERLRDDRDQVARQVDTLLDGGWSGPAATAYAASWAEWCSGAEQVLDALVAMTRLLDAVHRDLTERDLGAGSGLSRIAARLG